MKILKKLKIFLIVLAMILGALGLGFLIDTLVLGLAVTNSLTYSIVSAVCFFLCIVTLTILMIAIIDDKKEIKRLSQSGLIILPSKRNKSFDVRDIDLLTIDNKELLKKELPCLLAIDANSCFTCKSLLAEQQDKQVKKYLSSTKSKVTHGKNIKNVKDLISGVSKDTNLIILKQKKVGKVFVPSEFIEWPVEEQVVEIIENDFACEPVKEMIIKQPCEVVTLKTLKGKDEITSFKLEDLKETIVYEVIPENVQIVEELNEIIDEEAPIVLGEIIETQPVEKIVVEEPIEEEAPIVLGEIIETQSVKEIVVEEPIEEIAIKKEIVEEVSYIAKQTYFTTYEKHAVESVGEELVEVEDESGLVLPYNQFVEWPADQSANYKLYGKTIIESKYDKKCCAHCGAVIEKMEPKQTIEEKFVIVEEPKIEQPQPIKETPIIKKKETTQQVISIKSVEHEKEFVVEAEDLYENEEIVGDDSRVFTEHEELEAVAMTLKKTITSSLFTGKQNVVFVKRPPVRLFTKIYIIDRATESIIGEAMVRMYERGLKKQIWNKYNKNSTITKDQYDTYYSSSLLACALVIKTVSKYRNPAPIINYGINKVPSTFIYIVD